MNEIKVRNIQDIETFENIRAEWDRLLQRNVFKSAFITWEWINGWWQANGIGRKLWLVTAWQADELVGAAPLMLEIRKKFGFPLRTIVNIGTPQADVGGGLFYNDAVTFDVWNYLAQNKNNWDILELNELVKDGIECQTAQKAFTFDRFAWREEHKTHYYISLENSWENFSERLARKFRYNLRRALRLAEEIGPVEIRRYTGAQVTWEVFQIIIEINRHANYPRLYNSQTEQLLIRKLVEQSQPKQGWLDVYILWVNGEPIAYEYGFQCEGRFEDWRSGFDTRFPSNISIGKLLAMEVVQKCIQEQYNEIDFLRGVEMYKQEWMPSKREYVSIRIFNRKSLPAMLAYFWLEKIKPILKKKKPVNPGKQEKINQPDPASETD